MAQPRPIATRWEIATGCISNEVGLRVIHMLSQRSCGPARASCMLHGRLLPAGGWRNEKGGHCWLRESQQLTLCAFSTKSICPWFVSSTRCRMVLVVQRECRDVGGFRLAGNVGRLRARNAAAVSGEHHRVRVHAFQRSRFVRGFCHQHAVARSMWSRGNVETLEGSAWPEMWDGCVLGMPQQSRVRIVE